VWRQRGCGRRERVGYTASLILCRTSHSSIACPAVSGQPRFPPPIALRGGWWGPSRSCERRTKLRRMRAGQAAAAEAEASGAATPCCPPRMRASRVTAGTCTTAERCPCASKGPKSKRLTTETSAALHSAGLAGRHTASRCQWRWRTPEQRHDQEAEAAGVAAISVEQSALVIDGRFRVVGVCIRFACVTLPRLRGRRFRCSPQVSGRIGGDHRETSSVRQRCKRPRTKQEMSKPPHACHPSRGAALPR
jgi:hypothetical protein